MKPRFMVRTVQHTASIEASLSICYLSDLHFNGLSKPMADDLITWLTKNPMDLILLGGDYLDTRRGEPHFAKLLGACSELCPTYAIGGNHDRFYGEDRIRNLCACYGVIWLNRETTTVNIKTNKIILHGGFVPTEVSSSHEVLSIVILHEPVDPEKLQGKCDLAFAGHLHGCQFVFWQRGFDLYPGKLFYRNNFLEWSRGDLSYFISRGLGDTLPLRYNCPKEVVRVMVSSSE